MSAASEFQRQLGADVVKLLGSDYSFRRSSLRFSKPISNGLLAATFSGSNKWSPSIHLDFYFGIAFSQLSAVEKRLGLLGRYAQSMHLCQYTPNCNVRRLGPFKGQCSWVVDIRSPPPNLAQDVAQAINGLAVPFCEAYGSLEAARKAIVSNDPYVLGGWLAWRTVLYIDFVLGDLKHFEEWSRILEPVYLKQAKDEMQKILALAP